MKNNEENITQNLLHNYKYKLSVNINYINQQVSDFI